MSGDRPTIQERYRSAVRSSNLKSKEATMRSDSDVLGAFGLADRQLTEGYVRTGPDEGYAVRKSPLSVPLERLLAGDNAAVHEICAMLSEMAWGKGKGERVAPKLTRSGASDMGRMVLAWFRHGTCKPCGGHGYELIPGVPVLDFHTPCDVCKESGKRPLESEFVAEHRDIARWLVAEMERALSRAGPMAMAAIAPRLDI